MQNKSLLKFASIYALVCCMLEIEHGRPKTIHNLDNNSFIIKSSETYFSLERVLYRAIQTTYRIETSLNIRTVLPRVDCVVKF